MSSPAIVLTHGLLHTMNAKTAHGLLRGTERFRVVAVIDRDHSGLDAGTVMDGNHWESRSMHRLMLSSKHIRDRRKRASSVLRWREANYLLIFGVKSKRPS